MRYGLTRTIPPAEEPVTLAVVKTHLRIDHDAEDALITAWIAAARRLTEDYCHQFWVEQAVTLTYGCFPGADCPLRVPFQPVVSVDGISYLDSNGDAATLDAADYQTWLDATPPEIAPVPNTLWPLTQFGALAAVTIELTVGYGDAIEVPEQVKSAMLLTIGDWDKNRDGQAQSGARTLPQRARDLLDTLWTGAYS